MGFWGRLFGRGEAHVRDQLQRAEARALMLVKERYETAERLEALRQGSAVEIAALKEQLRDVISRGSEVDPEFRRVSNELSNVRSRLVRANAREESLQQSLNTFTKRCNDLDGSLSAAVAEAKQLRVSLAKREAEVKTLTQTVAYLQSGEAELSQKVKEKSREIRSLKTLLKKTDEKVSVLTDQLIQTEQRLALSQRNVAGGDAEGELLHERDEVDPTLGIAAEAPQPSGQDASANRPSPPPPANRFGTENSPGFTLAGQPTNRITAAPVEQDRLENRKGEVPSLTGHLEWDWSQPSRSDDDIARPRSDDFSRLVDSLPDASDEIDAGEDWISDDFEENLPWTSKVTAQASVEHIESLLNEERHLADDNGPSPGDLRGERSSQYSRKERAVQIATYLVEKYSLPSAAMPALQSIFDECWWGAAKNAVINLLERGASYQEVSLAFKLRQFWEENDEFSMYFLESVEPCVRDSRLPWVLAFDFVRSFQGIPDIEELEQYLIESVEFWLTKRSLHYLYPSYLLYFKGIIDSRQEGEIIAPPRSTGRLPL
jgi:predicted nuclease with TOPRIM domain